MQTKHEHNSKLLRMQWKLERTNMRREEEEADSGRNPGHLWHLKTDL